MSKLIENTTGANAPNVATTDENLSVNDMFQQALIPSLGRQIFPVEQIHGPTAALFNIRKKPDTVIGGVVTQVNDVELLRSEVICEPSISISTGITQEAIQDLRNQYGSNANVIVGNMLRGLANRQENASTIAFLNLKSLVGPNLTRSVPTNPRTTMFEIIGRTNELVAKMNIPDYRSYHAYIVLPFSIAGSLMSLAEYVNGKFGEELHLLTIGKIRVYVNPDPLATDAYVGLHDEDMSKSSGVFSPYMSDVVTSINADTGEEGFHIYNRYALTASPLHTPGEEMFHRFTIV